MDKFYEILYCVLDNSVPKTQVNPSNHFPPWFNKTIKLNLKLKKDYVVNGLKQNLLLIIMNFVN